MSDPYSSRGQREYQNAMVKQLGGMPRKSSYKTASARVRRGMRKRGVKLSKTPSAIKRRKMRASQSPKQRAARLAKRREAMARWTKWYRAQSWTQAKALSSALRRKGRKSGGAGGKKKASGWAKWRARGGGRGRRKR